MKKLSALIALLAMLLSPGLGWGQLLNENFSYTVGTDLTANGWGVQGVATPTVAVTASSISYAGYLSSGIGNEVTLAVSGQDVNRTFAAQTSGTVYASCLVNVTSATTTGDYFFHLGPNPIGTSFQGRVYVKRDALSNLSFGITRAGAVGTVIFTPFSYSLNTTYLLVLRFTIVAGATNDLAAIYINPALNDVEPTTGWTISTDTPADLANIGAVALRQGSASNAAALKLDGIRVATTWADIVGGAGVSAPITQASNITFDNIGQAQMDVSWTSGNGAKRVVIMNTTNSFTSPADATDPTANTVYGGIGEQVVYNGAGSSIPTITGLAAGTTYWYRVYEYNGSGSTTKYLTSTATNNPNSQATSAGAVAPIIITPTSSSITSTSAILGGTISSDGGSAITERGTVWSTISPVTIANNKLAEVGTAIGVFTHSRTSLPSNTLIYYAAYATNGVGTTLTDEASFTTLKAEPSNHVTDFIADVATPAFSALDVVWTDATGTTIPDGYVIKASDVSYAAIVAPVDGTPETQGTLVKLVAAGVEEANFTGLDENTTYYFKIFPYTNTGTLIDYKTDGTVPQDEATTSYGIPLAPIAAAATNVSSSSFTANWGAVTGATGYRLDVYTIEAVTNASDLFISEYIEGSSNNKAIEIYNGTGSSVDLSGYELHQYNNGSPTVTYTLALSGTLASDAVYTIVNNSSTIFGTVDLSTSSSVMNFNGDDAIALYKVSASSNVDIFGRIGEDPGTGWTGVGGYSTLDKTLVRKSTVSGGVTTNPASGFPTLTTEWDVYNQNTLTYFGSHTFSGGSTSTPVYSDVNVGNVATYSVTGLDPVTTYYYVVRAVNAAGTSANSNEISVTTPLPVYSLVGANDNASNYSSWVNTSDEGCGFGAWSLYQENNAGFFLGDPSSAGIVMTNPAFGLYANTTESDFANADRAFVAPLSIGSTLSVDWGVNWDSDGSGSKGINLYTGGVVGTQIININMGGSTAITINGNAMFNNYGTAAMTLNFEYVSAGQLRVYGTGKDGIETYDQTIAVAGAPDAIRFYASGLNSGDQRQPYFNNMKIVTNPSGIPLLSSVFVKGCVTLVNDLEVQNLTIESGNNLQIGSLSDLSVNGTLTNNAGASNLVVKSNATSTGSLIHNTASVPATIERYVTAANWATASDGWHLLSSPVASQSISGDWIPTGIGNDYDLYAFDETKLNEYWLNQKVVANNITTFETGKAYLAAYEQSATKTFTGDVNVADVTLSGLTNTVGSAFPGWHLVGNPFASAIDYDLGTWTKTNIDEEIQVWNSVAASYQTATEVGGIVPAMNGFMVHTSGSGELIIPADSRIHDAANWYKSDEEFILVKANDLETSMSQSSIVRFNAMATDAYDADFDSYFLQGFAPAFYSTNANEVFALNTLPEISNSLVIPFGFTKNASSNFSIELAKSISGATIYLTDKKASVTTNLTEAGSYNFTASEGDDVNRFTLHFGSVGIDDLNSSSDMNVYSNSGIIYVSLQQNTNATVKVYNLTGQLVLQNNTNGKSLTTMNASSLNSGIYVVSVINGNQVISKKVVVRK